MLLQKSLQRLKSTEPCDVEESFRRPVTLLPAEMLGRGRSGTKTAFKYTHRDVPISEPLVSTDGFKD